MLLSCRILENVCGVNDFGYTTQAEYTEGSPTTIYIQLVDKAKDQSSKGFVPSGRRFVPAAGATLRVTVDSIDDDKKVTRTATQPYSLDGSIWSFSMLSTDTIRGTADIRLELTQSSVIIYGNLKNAISISAQDAN